ncbi:hypothetical protein QX249_10805 [Vibrio parahaemolyticus]|uniref:Uncharacterized protein n=1 Tax=Vibrio parahaemolyticus TaxID=670 RepID=A0AAW8Q025_VIBPH|nr:hypothetical protein [Vibrio parahaemolyticus]MDS1821151.1 hypothetical protein [Vibrio parahaemolyticus]
MRKLEPNLTATFWASTDAIKQLVALLDPSSVYENKSNGEVLIMLTRAVGSTPDNLNELNAQFSTISNGQLLVDIYERGCDLLNLKQLSAKDNTQDA